MVKVAVVPELLANFASNGPLPPPAATKVSVSVPVVDTGDGPLSVTEAGGCVAATPVAGSPLMVTAGGAPMTIVNCWTMGVPTPVRSPGVAEMVNVELPATVGFPLIAPVEGSSAKPAGRLPTVTAQLAIVIPATVRVVVG